MRISDWSSDVCSSDLPASPGVIARTLASIVRPSGNSTIARSPGARRSASVGPTAASICTFDGSATRNSSVSGRSEEHTSELQSLMRSSYAVFCLKKKIYKKAQPFDAKQHSENIIHTLTKQYNTIT